MRSKICYVGSLGWVVSGVSGFIARGAEFCHSVRSTFLTGCVWRSEGTDDAETWRPYCARLSRCLGDALVVQWLKHSTVNTFFFPTIHFSPRFYICEMRIYFPYNRWHLTITVSQACAHPTVFLLHWCSSNKSFKGHLRKRSESWRWSEAFCWKLIHSN